MSSKISRNNFIRQLYKKIQKPRIISCRVMIIHQFLKEEAATAGAVVMSPKYFGIFLREVYTKFQKPRIICCQAMIIDPFLEVRAATADAVVMSSKYRGIIS